MEKTPASILTALILTYNEERNIGRVLKELQWLEKVVILDSYSTDSTISIIHEYPNTEIHYRKFDTHATQWNFGLSLVKSEWVLTLDADYVLTPEFVAECRKLILDKYRVAYFTRFKFVVFEKPLLRDNTTPRPVLFKKDSCVYFDDGHTQRLSIVGDTSFFKSYILHDDRKPLTRWLTNLDSYSIKECNKLLNVNSAKRQPSMVERIRRTKVLAPFFVFFYCLFVNGSILNGWRGWHYTLQRTLVEIWFALRLIEEDKFKER